MQGERPEKEEKEKKVLWCWNCGQYVIAVKHNLGWDCSQCGVMIG